MGHVRRTRGGSWQARYRDPTGRERAFVEGSRVAVEFWTTMRVDGDPVTLPGCLMLDFDDEWACRRLREYRHFMPGRLEPPDG
jgi:hypothetical protein